ncbi:hypothetical protein PCC7418_2196 [Halothece sp. PCC 7418]|uniref:hypothetical protein n=1 Tax=Halothece sp. (strain PCC 7418) TaxID=65093 RepID=UPI0002A06EB9|nr:hypothetical protein [Halothece sp. PCC 7418]AFZ44352.1 hypothetical protein PCC7418_2196 [Halothece sp. PCC 7418]
MSQNLNLELSDEVYQTLKQQAKNAGLSLQEWIVFSLTQQSHNQEDRTVAEKEAVRDRFRRHAGAINLGYPTGADNESIDADLARAYNNENETEN